jgi:hypothetical protein
MNQHQTRPLADGDEAVEIQRDGSRKWLLFAGSGSETTGSLVATFRDAPQSRRAFVNERLRSRSPGAWARLEALDSTGHIEVLCWFGPTPGISLPDGELAVGGTPKAVRATNRLRREQRVQTSSLRRTVAAPVERAKARSSWLGGALTIAFTAVIGLAWLIGHEGTTSSRRTPTNVDLNVGYEAIRSETDTYAPGTSKSWATSEGLRQFTVLEGTLSVHDGHGHGRDYRAGESYVAAWAPLTVSNQTDEPVTATVTFLRPLTTSPSRRPRVAPAD